MEAFIKGILIGFSFLIPGLSGGTMMIVLNVFDEAIHSLNELIHGRFYKIRYMFKLGLGTILGIWLFSPVIAYCLEHAKFITTAFFVGVILSSTMEIVDKIKSYSFVSKDLIYIVIGLVFVVALTLVHPGNFVSFGTVSIKSVLYLLIAGIPIAAALILPGISTSFLLLTFGIYETTLNAIKNGDVGFLVPLGIGILLGAILLTSILEKMLTKYPKQSYSIILGFVLGSFAEVLLTSPKPSILEGILGALALCAGVLLVNFIRKTARKKD